jgi:hypothetical protein
MVQEAFARTGSVEAWLWRVALDAEPLQNGPS